ncbi:hypothetical protein [Spiroplasma turonicum]|uniref:hypothetical protein n=1 Tax=Spiroplasma turonicum TaxID=216946 RepID=UPI00130E644D|nr:hypothetical protein [Spiroplasma turonicum]
MIKFMDYNFDDKQFIENAFKEIIIKNNKNFQIEDKKIKSYIYSWVEVRNIVILWTEAYNNDSNCKFKISDLENLYMIIDNNYTYWKFFQENSDELEDLEERLNNVFNEIIKAKTLKKALNAILIFCHKNYLDGILGRFTSFFNWMLLQALLIFKNYSPIIAKVDKNTQILWFYPLVNMLYNDISSMPMSKWNKSYYFKKTFDFCYENSVKYNALIKKIS